MGIECVAAVCPRTPTPRSKGLSLIPVAQKIMSWPRARSAAYLNQAGWQQESYEDNDFHNLPIALACRPDGTPGTIQVEYPDRSVAAQIWRAEVGRIPLYLLDTNIAANKRVEDRDIADQLYGGDREMRIKQEILLGIGGYRALQALGIEPTVYHIKDEGERHQDSSGPIFPVVSPD